MYHTTRKPGQWVEIRCRRTGAIVRLRAARPGGMRYEVDAALEDFEILRPASPAWPEALPVGGEEGTRE